MFAYWKYGGWVSTALLLVMFPTTFLGGVSIRKICHTVDGGVWHLETWRGVCLTCWFWTIRKHFSLQGNPGKPLYRAIIALVPCRTPYQCFCVIHASSTTEITEVRLILTQPAERVISSVTVKRPTGLLVTVSNYILLLIQSLSSSSRVIPHIYGLSRTKFMILIYEYAIYKSLKVFCSVLG